ncbi:MAG TPA: Na+/H+ antiporter NhaC family protein [Gemmatimonadales bacterium]|nr:Na+/H+ antiporter NhaC family protein [Gemmatimonadales bacterium]
MTAPRFPHPLTLLVACILIAAALTWVLPAGEYQRREDPATGRSVVVAGTYAPVEPSPVGPFQALVGIPRGMSDAASVIFYVFLVGGAFAIVERTGALNRLVNSLVAALSGRGLLVIPIAGLAFATGGVLIQMQEELIAFVPVLLLLTSRLGFNPLVAVAMSLGASAVGASFSPINPFQVGIAQKVAEVDLLSGWGFRVAFLLPALTIWLAGTVLYARRTRAPAHPVTAEPAGGALAGGRHAAVLATVLLAFVWFVIGVLRYQWDFDQLAALFFVMGVAAGLLGGLRLSGTVDAFVDGLRSMAFAALLIGFARGIYVVLEDGRIVDTIVHGLFTPLGGLPVTLSALGMMAAHTLVHVPVPSTSGQAVLTMPLLVPLSDLIGLSRQVTVLAYQYGAGLCELLTPTNGALMAMLAAAGVRYEEWVRFAAPVFAVLLALAAAAIGAAVLLGV